MKSTRVVRALQKALLQMLPALAVAALCCGQGDRGLITGVIEDPTRAVVPVARIRATNVAAKVAVTTESNTRGLYTLDFLMPGTYTITAEKVGFKHLQQDGVQVRVNDRITLDITLVVGPVVETVEVHGQAPLLESTSSSVGTVIDSRRIRDLPLGQGNPTVLQFLVPGLVYLTDPGWTRTWDQPSVTSVSGAGQGGIEFALDGNVNMGERKMPAYQPPPEFVQEYKVVTVAYDATKGHASAGWVDMTLKSGTNGIHGSGYYYYPEQGAERQRLLQ